ncbi:MAG TPA: porin, partial [Bryobacteraceae bacterium]
MRSLKCVALAVCGALLTTLAAAQTAEQTPAAPSAPAPPDSPGEWSVGPITFSGLIDGYYSFNLNHPESGTNNLRNFDVKANQFSLNMAKVTLEHTPDPVGFRLDLGVGRAFDMIHASETAPSVFRNIEQAYISFKPPRAKGLEMDFGEFVTSAGAEVIETKDNWNYSRSLLFAYAIPYYHFGLRVTMPLGKHFNAALHVVNGWNNVEDNNSGKTVGLMTQVVTRRVTWTSTYHAGPEKAGTDRGWRHLYDTTLLLTPAAKLSSYVNFDYGVDKNMLTGNKRWTGIAWAGRYAVNSWFALAPRLEWFNDANGFSTGIVQKVKELTMTAEFKAKEGLLSRLEYRHDWSNARTFDRGAFPLSWK